MITPLLPNEAPLKQWYFDYLNGKKTCQEIGKEIGRSTRQVQRILKDLGFIRTRSESYKLAIEQGRMTYDHLKKDIHTREYRKTINLKMRYSIFARDNFRCVICGRDTKSGARLQVDHIQALCDGGENVESNLQTMCLECNVGKYHQQPVNKGKHK